jgi:hypothetical protein
MHDKPDRIYDPDDLAMLSRVLQEASEATVNGAVLTELEIQKLRSQLGKVIMDLFTAGENDPEALKQAALDSVGAR